MLKWLWLALAQGASLLAGAPGRAPADSALQPPAAALRAVLVDERGLPCARSRVSVCLARVGAPEKHCVSASSDAGGRVVVGSLPGGVAEVQVRTETQGGARIPAVELREDAELDLGTLRVSRRGTVRGRVIASGGAPLSGATVTAESKQRTPSEAATLQAVTAEDGAFAIRDVPAGEVLMRARHPAFADGEPAPVAVDPAEAPEYVELSLNEGGRLVGRVLSVAPTVSGTVEWRPFPADEGRAPRAAKLDPDAGTFVLEHLPAGPALVTWRAAAGEAQRQVEVEMLDGETTEVEFADRRILVGGRVTRAGAPLPNHSVTLLRAGSVPALLRAGHVADGPQRLAAATDEDGRYELVVDEPGTFLARVQDPAGRAAYAPREVEIPDVLNHTLDLDMASAELRGVVVDEESRPISGASVLVLGRSPGTRAPVSIKADPRGGFVVSLSAGQYRVSAEAPGMIEGHADVAVTEGITRVQVELSRGLALQGVVVDSSGRPVPGVPVVLATPDLAGGSTRESTSAADGSFRIDGLEGLPFTIMAGAAPSGFALDAGKLPSPPLRLQLQPPARVRLRVYEGTGAPVVGATVMVTEINGQRAPAPAVGWSDGTGRVEIAVPEGGVALRVWKQARSAGVLVQAVPGAVVESEVVLPD